jgi:hypothetical protein
MTVALVVCLIVLSLYLAKRLNEVSGENTTLRGQVASLKKQLVQRRNTAKA